MEVRRKKDFKTELKTMFPNFVETWLNASKTSWNTLKTCSKCLNTENKNDLQSTMRGLQTGQYFELPSQTDKYWQTEITNSVLQALSSCFGFHKKKNNRKQKKTHNNSHLL